MTDAAPTLPQSREDRLDALVNGLTHLVSPPEIHLRLEQVLESEYGSWTDVADVIAQDPQLSAKLLKLANSAFHGRRRVDTLSAAAALLGTRALYDLALGVSALGVFQKLPAGVISASDIWRHSLYTALVAKHLARFCNVLHPERLFVAGLLHEVGLMVLGLQTPEALRVALSESSHSVAGLMRAERAILGFDHAEVGARLLERWKLPGTTVNAIRWHIRPEGASPSSLDAAIIHLADAIAETREEGALFGNQSDLGMASKRAWELTGLQPHIAEELPDGLSVEFRAASQILTGNRL